MPSEHALIMTGHSVRQTMALAKTQTRRVVSRSNSLLDDIKSPTKEEWKHIDLSRAVPTHGRSMRGNWCDYLKIPALDPSFGDCLFPRVQPGDTIRIKETWAVRSDWDEVSVTQKPMRNMTVYYRADDGHPHVLGRWRSPLFMPKWASRLRLLVKDVRCERVQDISEEDAIAEGATGANCIEASRACTKGTYCYRHAWNSINSRRGHPWEKNNLVWCYSYEVKA